jgi:hypothetical protein
MNNLLDLTSCCKEFLGSSPNAMVESTAMLHG